MGRRLLGRISGALDPVHKPAGLNRKQRGAVLIGQIGVVLSGTGFKFAGPGAISHGEPGAGTLFVLQHVILHDQFSAEVPAGFLRNAASGKNEGKFIPLGRDFCDKPCRQVCGGQDTLVRVCVDVDLVQAGNPGLARHRTGVCQRVGKWLRVNDGFHAATLFALSKVVCIFAVCVENSVTRTRLRPWARIL